jgi:Flp pilus assembly protein TadG
MGEAPPRCRAYRHRRRAGEGSTLVEFALVAPIGFVLLLGIIVTGIVVTNYIQLTNAARDGARLAAICGGVNLPTTQMPDGSGFCSPSKIQNYIANHLVSVPLAQLPTVSVCLPSNASAGACAASGSPIGTCQVGKIVEVDMTYDQPLYVPLISSLLQTKPNGTRTISASAQATCEQ